jgi:hypothetical protein
MNCCQYRTLLSEVNKGLNDKAYIFNEKKSEKYVSAVQGKLYYAEVW